MNFSSFGAIFVYFFEARDLYVNIFRILDRTAKIPDCGLISEKPEGLSAKSTKSGPEREARGARLGPHRDSSGVEEDERRWGRLGGVGAR
jgi:hypothetical protein